jgi:3-oxoacyl-[acyl-carrier-protein] synthase II
MADEIWITGFGLVSPLGATPATCWERLSSGGSDPSRHPSLGYACYPMRDFDAAQHVQRRADVRQMGELMLYATVAARRALQSADLSPAQPALSRLQISVAADGGERDLAADETALAAVLPAKDPATALNEQLMRARPSHFLTQLPNLIPSNICIVNGFAAPSRTLMGTEAMSAEALRDAVSRIRAGQADLMLVGSTKNALCVQSAVCYTAGGLLSHDPLDSLWREENTGFCLGSVAAFVVVESAEHARARSARGLARITAVDTSFGARDQSSDCERRLLARWQRAVPKPPHALGVLSGITGQGDLARRERNFLSGVQVAGTRVSVRATALAQGHTVEAAFFANLVFALLCLERRQLFPPLDRSEPLETATLDEPLKEVLVTSWGSTHAEGFAQLEAVT